MTQPVFVPSTASAAGKQILVIEDDPSIVLGLRMNLEAEGYSVQVAEDGEAGLSQARRDQADLIILDVMLPRLNGFEVLRQMRSEGICIPTIVLSARDAELDIVMGLEFGAEDYVTKPFGLAELLARIKAVLRRPAPERAARSGEAPARQRSAEGAPAVIQVGELSIDSRARQVKRAGEEIPLTATEFDILWCLVQADGRVLSREEIQALVWGPRHHGTLRTIDNFMMQLRTKLERDPTAPEHLLTVRGVGYRLAQ
ncbi:MAG TPA: response regulator transcription factor [Polyangiaceae bacterium]|jgi:DNA-binding response OmpR family regulator|nr:response regulator transcription factor [Polyangiaceae bacterium]